MEILFSITRQQEEPYGQHQQSILAPTELLCNQMEILFSIEIHYLFLFNKRLIEEIFFGFVILVAILMSSLIIILVFLEFHQHS
jgi:hypothetical protein